MSISFGATRSSIYLLFAVALTVILSGTNGALATPLSRWSTSCTTDPGAIVKSGSMRIFKTSQNHCPGGIFLQRAEIQSEQIPPSMKGGFLFETYVSLQAATNDQFTLFQIHDGRLGCAPPLSMDVLPDGRLFLKSDIKTGEGENCIRGALSEARSMARIYRDGREQKLSVLVDFNGVGGFNVWVSIDGVPQISGTYDADRQPTAYRSERFYFKHGVYSQRIFKYVMTSRELTVSSVRLVN